MNEWQLGLLVGLALFFGGVFVGRWGEARLWREKGDCLSGGSRAKYSGGRMYVVYRETDKPEPWRHTPGLSAETPVFNTETET